MEKLVLAKSSLLLTIANETIKTSGSIMVRGRLSLATQTAFVFSNTLQKNITFGNPLDRHRYRKVIRRVHWILIWKTLLAAIKWSLANEVSTLAGARRHGLG